MTASAVAIPCARRLILMVFLFFCATELCAQADYSSATLKGRVSDPQGSAIAGATVTATSAATSVSRSTKTAGDGGYQFLVLPAGTYRLTFEAQGFAKTIAGGVELTVGQVAVYDAQLKVGAVSETVEVSSETTPVVQPEETQQANTINLRQVEQLPNINRSFTYDVYTIPGISNSEAPKTQNPGFTGYLTSGFSVGGSNGRNDLSTIDGGENQYGTGQDRVLAYPVDAIQEYQVNRNAFAAEFGFTNGSAINIVTKSGGDRWHGSAFGYFRNQSTEAQNFFNGLQGLPKAFSQNLYVGDTLGGPIVRGKLFFFTAYEFQRIDTPFFNQLLGVPETQGISAPGLGANCSGQFTAKTPDQLCYINALKTSGDPFLVGFANGITPGLSPLNNPALNTIMTRDNGVFNSPDRLHNIIARFDFVPSQRDAINLRVGYAHNNFRSLAGGIFNATPDGYELIQRDFSILASWTRTVNPSLVNQALVQIVPRNRTDAVVLNNNGINFSLGNLGAPGPAGISTFGRPSLLPYLAHQQRYQFEDNVTWSRGRHTWKFGASYRPANYHIENDLWFNPEFDFRDGAIPLINLAPASVQGHLVAFNLGHGLPATGPVSTNLSAAQSFVFGIPLDVIAGFNNPVWTGWGHYFGSYIQDSWKMSQRLTLNAGLRFDVDGEPAPLSTNFYASPRVGLSWDPFGDHKTVFRAGGGLYYAPVNVLIPSYGALLDGSGRYINQTVAVLCPGPPFCAAPDTRVAQLWGSGVAKGELPFGSLTPADYAAVGIPINLPGATVGYSVAPKYHNPYTVQASASFAHEFTPSTSLEVGYLMYHGVHLQMPVETAYQEIAPGNPFCPTPACTDASGGPLYAPLTGQLQHTTYSSIGNSIYHGLTTSLTKRYTHGLQFQVNYTWSKAIDDTIDFSSFQNWFRPSRLNLFRAVSVFDVPHLFVANAVYSTPFKAGEGKPLHSILADITLSPILSLHSGLPFSVRTPSLVNKINGQTLDNNYAMPFFASRDANRGAAYYSFDMSFQKALFIQRERGVRLNLIVQGTNLLNHVNFNRVNDVFDVSGFTPTVTLPNGQALNMITGPFTGLHGAVPTSVNQLTQPLFYSRADNPRQIQFGLKAAF